MRNILICDNYSELDGGGLFLCMLSEPVMENVTIVNNYSEITGGGICSDYNSNPSLINCILWNNFPQEIFTLNDTITISYSDIQGGEEGIITNGNGIVNWLEGNINDDPLFNDPLNGDYHLTVNSPCIDAGDLNSPLDPDGTIADMGAYYFIN